MGVLINRLTSETTDQGTGGVLLQRLYSDAKSRAERNAEGIYASEARAVLPASVSVGRGQAAVSSPGGGGGGSFRNPLALRGANPANAAARAETDLLYTQAKKAAEEFSRTSPDGGGTGKSGAGSSTGRKGTGAGSSAGRKGTGADSTDADTEALAARYHELLTQAQASENASRSRALGAESRARQAARAEELRAQAEEIARQLSERGVNPRNTLGNVGRSALGGAVNAVKDFVNGAWYFGQNYAAGVAGQNAVEARRIAALTGGNASDVERAAREARETPLQTLAHWGDAYNAETARRTRYVGAAGRALNTAAEMAGGLAPSLAAEALAPGAGTAMRAAQSLGGTTEDYLNAGADNARASLAGYAAAGGVLAGDALARGVTRAGTKLLTSMNRANLSGVITSGADFIGLQNKALPNAALGGVSGLAYAAGETGVNELYKALSDENYTPDWGQIGTQAVTAFAFGALSSAIRTARVSSANRSRMQALNEALRENYAAWEAAATPEQKTRYAAQAMNSAAALRNALANSQVVGADREMRDVADFLWSVEQQMAEYAGAASGDVAGLIPARTGGGTAPVVPQAAESGAGAVPAAAEIRPVGAGDGQTAGQADRNGQNIVPTAEQNRTVTGTENKTAPGAGAATIPVVRNAAPESGTARNRRLETDDAEQYMQVGDRKHVRDQKARAAATGSAVLSNPGEITDFIRGSLKGTIRDTTKSYGQVGSDFANAVRKATNNAVKIDNYYLELDSNQIAHISDHIIQDKDVRNIPLTQKQIEHLPDYIDNYDDLIDVIRRKDGSVRLMLGKKINGHSIIIETISKGRQALHPVTAYQIDTESYERKYGSRALDRSSTSRPETSGTVDISRQANTLDDKSVSQPAESVKPEYTGADGTLPDLRRESYSARDWARREQENNLRIAEAWAGSARGDAGSVETRRTRAERNEYEQNLADELADREAAALREETDAAEAANRQAEREGKRQELAEIPKAPKSRAALKKWVQERFNIQEGSRKRVNEIVDTIADRLQTTGELPAAMVDQLFDALYDYGSVTREADSYYRSFRDSVKGTRIYIGPEVRADFGDGWREFASRARSGGITLTDNLNDGGIDVHARELSEIFGEGWLRSDAGGVNLKDQIEDIVDMAERGRPRTLTNAEADDILRGQWGDEAVQEKLDRLERDFRETLDLFQRSAETEGEVRTAAEKKIAKGRAELRDAAKRQMERRALSELRNKTLKSLQWLRKNRNRAPADLREKYDDILDGINTLTINAANEMHIDKATGKTYKDLAAIYSSAKEHDPNFLPDKKMEELLLRLCSRNIADMDVSELEALYKAAMRVRTEFYNRNNVINDELGRTFSEAYHASVDEINATKGEAKLGENWFNVQQLTPMNVVERMAGWDPDSTFYSFAKQMESGERDYKRYTVEAAKAIAPVLRQYKDWARRSDGQGKDAIWYEFEVPELLERNMGDKPMLSDKTVKVWYTPAQKVHMALEAENYDNLRHMEGGRTFADKELYSKGKREEAFAKGTTLRLAPETVREMVKELTEEEHALYTALKKFYNGHARDEINRISNILYGCDRAMSSHYAPIFNNQNYVGKEPGIQDSTAEGVGHLKSRNGYSKNPSYQISAWDAFERHTDQTARFVGYAIPVRNFNTLLNWRAAGNSMRDTIAHKWGEKNGTKYLDQLLVNVQNTRYTEQGTIERAANNVLSRYVTAVFGANPGLVLKQAASFPQAAAVLGFDTVPKPSQLRKKNIDTALIGKYTPELDYRLLGYATPETAQFKNNPGALDRNKITRFQFRGGAITAMDGATVRSIWPWAENYVSKYFPELKKGTQEEIDAGESPYYQKVTEMYNEAVSLTQPMYDTMHRAGIMQNGNGVQRAFTMFKTVPLQQYNTLRKMFGEMKAARKQGKNSKAYKAASRRAANAVTATLASIVMLEDIVMLDQLWKNGMKGYRDEDDALTVKSVAGKFARNAIGDLAGMNILGSELSDLIFNIFTGERWSAIEIPGGEQLNDIIDEFRTAAGTALRLLNDGCDVVSGGGDLGEYFRRNAGDYAGAVKEVAETAAMYLGGLPVENVVKYLAGPLRTIVPEWYVAIHDRFDTPTKSDLKGLKGKALKARVGNILENRFGEMPEGAAEELARLYAEYGGGVILPDTPSGVTIGGEEFALDAAARQKYDEAYTEAAKAALAGLRTNQDYQAMDDEERVAYLKRVYDAAGEYAKLETVPEYAEANPDVKAKYDALRAAGLSTARIVEVMAMKSALSSVKFADWIENAGFPGKTLEKVEDALNISTATYDDFKAAGMALDDVVAVTMALSGLEPKAGEKSVTRYQKLHAILDGDFTGKVKDQAMRAMLTEDDYNGYLAAKRYGIEDRFVDALEIKNNAEGRKDENGKTIAGTKMFEAMRRICKMDLPDNQKVALLEGVGCDMGGYRNYCWWMDLDDYVTRMESINDFHDVKDENGKVCAKRKDQVIEYINALPLDNDQKSALFVAAGYAMSGLDDCPWWKKWDIKGPYYPKG